MLLLKIIKRIGERRTNNDSGFTLIELIVVMVILGLLASIVIPKFTGRTEEARRKTARTQISQLQTACELYRVDNGRYPNSLEELTAVNSETGERYMDKIPKDPWGEDYVYEVTDGGKSLRITSSGGEGEPISNLD